MNISEEFKEGWREAGRDFRRRIPWILGIVILSMTAEFLYTGDITEITWVGMTVLVVGAVACIVWETWRVPESQLYKEWRELLSELKENR
jgi:hypothetical protein